MQFGFGGPPLTGIVYNTTLSRPDSALALALLYGLEGKREARVGAVAVSENSLGAAAFADVVFRFYQLGQIPNANRIMPVGLAADKPLPPDSPAVKAVLARVNDKGEPAYRRGIHKVPDTSEISAQLRNAMAYLADGTMVYVLSAPATYLARAMNYPGVTEQIKAKVKALVICECSQPDVLAIRKVLAEWPSPIVFMGRDTAEALTYPGSTLDTDFAWAPAHPVADFYRAARSMPYDAPALDPAAILYASRPAEFQLSDPGTLEATDSGELRFLPGGAGKHRRVLLDPAKAPALLATMRELIAAKPVPPPPRRRFSPEELEKLKKQREEELKKREEAEQKKATPPSPL
ncbi:MAG: hypothetical protein SGI92_30480 [Bryobacteraceae bacterium]|nr:hypothetical protein [Bryobacteraceae bacterium]